MYYAGKVNSLLEEYKQSPTMRKLVDTIKSNLGLAKWNPKINQDHYADNISVI